MRIEPAFAASKATLNLPSNQADEAAQDSDSGVEKLSNGSIVVQAPVLNTTATLNSIAGDQALSAAFLNIADEPAEATSAAEELAPRALSGERGDPLVEHLTEAQRGAFDALYSVEIAESGEILSPVEMQVNEYMAVTSAAGQLASDQANDLIEPADVTLEDIDNLVQNFQARIEQDLPLFEEAV
ncbi:hypothetical protein [Kineosporia babensis]|uniref:Uncharacterized protein n=1 Tax=Kineosporia babensis TaxID=499548 RepID=A0A9X1SXR0_9ACTN|nr:hypothetical protein [Kineosporia babensis]MCD5316211.1 hypothetical protein [Kineosporia babensis]